jgi:hypothetical protein
VLTWPNFPYLIDMKALFDGDIVVFRAGMAAERAEWHLKVGNKTKTYEYKRDAMDALDKELPGKYSRKEGEDYELWSERNCEPVSHALHNAKGIIQKSLAAVGCTEFDTTIFLSGATNFRDRIAETRPYKGNRDRLHRPTHEEAIKDYLRANYPTTVADDEEADDLLGIAQTEEGALDSVIISVDKDLDQIPGLKYNIMHDVQYCVTPEDAEYNFYAQLLTGDTVDNIPGLPRVGPSTASKILHGLKGKPEDMERECWSQYAIRSGEPDPWKYMLEQGQLLWIRRKAGEMWEPTYIVEDGIEAATEELSMYE